MPVGNGEVNDPPASRFSTSPLFAESDGNGASDVADTVPLYPARTQ